MTMPGAETRATSHLSAEQIALLRGLLLCQLAEHTGQASECRARVDDLTGQTDIDSAVEREMAEASAAHFDAVVCEATAALHRLDGGTYGVCERCASPIPFERLDAIPHARLCVGCPDAPAGFLG